MLARMAADTAFGAFTDDGPWELDLDHIAWRPAVDRLRAEVQASLPELTRPRRWPPGLRLGTTIRHLGGGVVAWAVLERRSDDRSQRIAGISRRLRVAAEHLGPTYIKLGQILSSGEGIFPEELVVEFKKCRDQVPPEPWPVIERVVEEELGRPPRHRVRLLRARARSPPRRSPRSTGRRSSTGPTSS